MRITRFLIKILPKIATHHERKIVLKNFLSLSTLQGLGYLFPLFLLPYLLRVIGPAKFGLIVFAQAFVQYFMILTDYGFSLTATRKISLAEDHNQKTSEIFSSVMAAKIVLAGISFLIFLLIIKAVPRFSNDWLVYFLSFGTVIGNTLFPVWFFQGKEKMNYITVINSLSGIANVICIFIYVKGPADYIFIPLINSLFAIVSGTWALYVAFRKFNLTFVYRTYRNIHEELRAGWKVFISLLAINTYTASRIFAVGLLTNNTITGYYSVADRIATFIRSFPQDSFSQAFYPRITRAFAKNKIRALNIMHRVQKGATIGFAISLPILFILSPLIVRLICARPYPEVTFTLRLLLVSALFVGANALKVQFLIVCGRADIYSRLHVGAAAAGLPLLFILVYLFSYPGAALATIITESGIFFLTARTLKKIIPSEM